LETLSNHSEAAATLLSVLAALFAGFLGYKQNQKRHVREYTLSVLSPLLTNDRLFAAHTIITDHIIDGRQLDYSKLSKEERDLVLQILGYYEFLSAAFLRGDLDDATVLRQRRASFKGAYDAAQSFIDERRKLLRRPSVYSELKTFVETHCR
jgi:hypothetical protein